MYAAPPSVDAQVFTTIPEKFLQERRALRMGRRRSFTARRRRPSSKDRPSTATEICGCPIFPGAACSASRRDGEVSVAAEYDGEPNGLKFHKDGRGFITDHKNGIMVFDPNSGKVEPLPRTPAAAALQGRQRSRLCVQRRHLFHRSGPDRPARSERPALPAARQRPARLRARQRPEPERPRAQQGRDHVFLAVTRANAIWRVPLMRDGTASKVGIFIQLSGGGGPDGLAIDEDDNIAVCHVGLGASGCSARSASRCCGSNRRRAVDDQLRLWRPGEQQLFITEFETGTILSADMKAAGRPMYSHA